MTIVEFLTARLDEDWANIHGQGALTLDDLEAGCKCESSESPTRVDCPARWAADVVLKRTVIAAEMDRVGRPKEFISEEMAARIRGRADSPVLRAMASGYAGHEDYNEEWGLPT